jgi:hypothetical protein
MGATSVTGKGLGSAEGMNKGTSRMTLGTGHLIGPHIVAAGNFTLTGSTGAVEIPTLPGVVGDYSFHVTADTANAVHVTSKAVTGFTINGTSGQVVSWMVVKNGL